MTLSKSLDQVHQEAMSASKFEDLALPHVSDLFDPDSEHSFLAKFR
jgi:hypothetical protein